jgi:hypothetical protein
MSRTQWDEELLRAKRAELKCRYGISFAEYERLFNKQGGLCAICGCPGYHTMYACHRSQKLAIDHCHETGKVRALLCLRCNTTIGKARDNADLLRKMAEYIDLHS